MHLQRQEAYPGGPSAWWERYLADARFRLEEEIKAHRAEYRTLKHFNRNQAVRDLDFIAARLASELYGGIITKREARRALVQ